MNRAYAIAKHPALWAWCVLVNLISLVAAVGQRLDSLALAALVMFVLTLSGLALSLHDHFVEGNR